MRRRSPCTTTRWGRCREVDWAHVERMRAEYPPLSSPDLLLDAIDPIDSNLDKIRHRIPTT
ncbi:hypothetical protein [Kribbella catacumbae]|uniref:hypothetical protein n=1 Tax=Kribbella catacumbae TaxID=460086 RepID=UPI0003A35ACB|nr:hypothetical protein [Kribbella catacumbae]